MSFSSCLPENIRFICITFTGRIWLSLHVLINVQLNYSYFHFAKVNNLNSQGSLKPNSMLVVYFFYFEKEPYYTLARYTKMHPIYFLLSSSSVSSVLIE